MAPTDIGALFAREETFRHRGVDVQVTVEAVTDDEFRAINEAEKTGDAAKVREAFSDFLRHRVRSLAIGGQPIEDPAEVAGLSPLVSKLLRSAMRDHVQEADTVKDLEASAKIKERETAGSGLRWLCEQLRYWQIEAGRDQGNG